MLVIRIGGISSDGIYAIHAADIAADNKEYHELVAIIPEAKDEQHADYIVKHATRDQRIAYGKLLSTIPKFRPSSLMEYIIREYYDNCAKVSK